MDFYTGGRHRDETEIHEGTVLCAGSGVLLMADSALYQPEGGLAEITIRTGTRNATQICIGGVHLCDLVDGEDGKYIVYKEPKKRAIRAKAQDLINMLGS